MITPSQLKDLREKATEAAAASGFTLEVEAKTRPFRIAANPKTVLTLLDAIEKMREALAAVAGYDHFEGHATDCQEADDFRLTVKMCRQALKEVFGEDTP